MCLLLAHCPGELVAASSEGAASRDDEFVLRHS